MQKTHIPRNLLEQPLWRAEHLGKPIPDSPHATSVALPLWQHVVGYEEKDPAVIDALTGGYPRFVFHPYVARLMEVCRERFAAEGECALVFPAESVAQRCLQWLQRKRGLDGASHAYGLNDIWAVTAPEAAFDTLKKFWQHFGDIVSSRQALATLEKRKAASSDAGANLRERIAGWTGESAHNVFLYPSGIAAVAAAHRLVQELTPDAKSVQVGFPYVDVLKIQAESDTGVHFFPGVNEETQQAVETLVAREKVSGIICEFAGNPLLTSTDVPRLAAAAQRHELPLIIDETLGTYANVDLLPHVDALVTSLTKYVAGAGDVMGGALILNRRSPFYGQLYARLQREHENLLWDEDARALESYSRDFPERMATINANAEAVCEWLVKHPKVDRLYYPKYTTPENFAAVKKAGGGYSGLFSVLLKDAPRAASNFYDRLRVSKGPSLGTNFTLACPYTLLAHYDELDEVERFGVSRYLVRVSVGLETADDLIRRFEDALR